MTDVRDQGELAERLRGLADRLDGADALISAADALDAQQRRIAELERAVRAAWDLIDMTSPTFKDRYAIEVGRVEESYRSTRRASLSDLDAEGN